MTVGSKVKQTVSALNGVKVTLEVYARQTQDGEAVTAYREGLNIVAEVLNHLEARVRTLEFEEPQYKGL